MTYPTPDLELSLLRDFEFVIGIDEVGRGAIAGPVAVGVCLVSVKELDRWPKQVRDSKLLSERLRLQVEPDIRAWAPCAVGLAGIEEIESLGINRALALSAQRGIKQLVENSLPRGASTCVLLDGTQDWLGDGIEFPVRIEKKADQNCVSVAAASIVAKVHRDQLMIELSSAHPEYGFDGNKGYASQGHIEALQQIGPSSQHRVSWLAKILGDGQLF